MIEAKQVEFPTNDRDLTASDTLAAVAGQTRQFTKDEANYIAISDEGEGTNCGACFFYRASLTSCQAVEGEIAASAVSDFFISRQEQLAALQAQAEGTEDMSNDKKREFKTVKAFEVKIDADQGIVDHLVAVMGNTDLGGDIIHNGAFTKTITERGHKVRVVDSHNYDSALDIVGKPVALWEVGRDGLPHNVLSEFPEATGGLMARTQFLMDTPEGAGIFSRIKAGAIDEYSIGYDALDHDFSKGANGDTVRNLRTIKLWEYGPVVFGMNPATTTLAAKGDKDLDEMTPELKQTVEDIIEASQEVLDDSLAVIGGIIERDTKAGRVISARNASRIMDTIANLIDILGAAGVDTSALHTTDDDEDEEKRTNPDRLEATTFGSKYWEFTKDLMEDSVIAPMTVEELRKRILDNIEQAGSDLTPPTEKSAGSDDTPPTEDGLMLVEILQKQLDLMEV